MELAELPPECRKHIEQAQPVVGEKPRWTQKRWEQAASAINAQIDSCAGFYDRQRELLK